MSDIISEPTGDGWDGTLYRETCEFVSEFGEDLLDWLQPQSREWILDVGCGTGELTQKLCERDCHAVGLDPSADMLREAHETFPGLPLVRADVGNFKTARPFDAVFSNAALHWIPRAERALRSIRNLLRPGGRFIAEMGAEGNVETIRSALHEELDQLGHEAEELDPWYFPAPEVYVSKLRETGFEVTHATSYDRPTEMFGEEGLKLWLVMFAGAFFQPLTDSERDTLISRLVDRLRDDLYENGQWVLDYSRLRFRAVKNSSPSRGDRQWV